MVGSYRSVAKHRAYLLRPVGSAAREKTHFEGWQIPLRFARTLAGGGAVLGLTGATSIGNNCVRVAGSRFMGALLGDVVARRVPVSAFYCYRVSLQRKKCCQQIISLNMNRFPSRCASTQKRNPCLGKMLGDAVRTALGMPHNNSAL
jgi:hypothetical protein